MELVVELWDTWSIRELIILSLLAQTFLVLFAPCRRQGGGKWYLRITIWLTYLFADWVAIFTIGLILRANNLTDLEALWAPFLLLHLGGPDSITSFSLEDNELWLRHLFALVMQVAFTIYVIALSLPDNRFWLPTFLVLIAGTIKYVERNLSFYIASFDHFGDNAICGTSSYSSRGPNKRTWIEMFKSLMSCEPQSIIQTSELGVDDSFLEEGWRYIKNATLLSSFLLRNEPFGGIIKILLAGPLISPNRRDLNRICFLQKTAQQVLQVIEIELSLLYEALHTKFPVVESKIGCVLRIISLSCIFGALFSLFAIQKPEAKFDVWLTYGLLIGAIALDFISIRFLTFSDFHNFQPYWRFEKYLRVKTDTCCDRNYEDADAVLPESIINRRRWSSLVSQLNFMTYYFDNEHKIWWHKLASFPNLRLTLVDTAGRNKYMSSKTFNEDKEWDFIVKELKEKAEPAETVEEGKRLCSRRGEGPILKLIENNQNESGEHKLIWSVRDLDYTESILTWHIATELCYRFEKSKQPTACDEDEEEGENYRSISKLISDYMFYLLERHPAMMADVFIDSRVIREATRSDLQKSLDSYKEVLELIGIRKDEDGKIPYNHRRAPDIQRYLYEEGRKVFAADGACLSGTIFAVSKHFFEDGVKTKSIVYSARQLVDELEQKDGTFPWKLMSQVWVEIMCYAAINCRPHIHAKQISQGGQFLTLVWLLMNHLGLGTNFFQDK